MEIRHLRYFLAVAAEGNFRRAAERCFVAQPTLSQQIQTLEGELGAQLFARSRRGTTLTPVGEVLRPYARRVVAEVERAGAAVRAAADGRAGTLRIGYEAAVVRDGFVGVIRDFRAAVPGVTLDFWEAGSIAQAEAVRGERADVGLILLPLDDERGLSVRALREAPIVAVVPAGHRLAGAAQIPLAELAGEPQLAWARASAPRVYDDYLQACARAGFTPDIVQVVRNVESLLALVAAGIGVGSLHAARIQPGYPGVVYASIVEPALTIRTGVIWRRDDPSPLLRRFLAAVGEAG